ncbi:MAG: hopanoid biosynthesis-associated protein HpnK [Nitrococcus mobilis]|nr:hopanoid biosynthesis-associated protein HpnK [Nitrococcus mobilis]
MIFTADDFGLTETVNDAVEQAHRRGLLNTTSLMVTAPASADAIRRAKANPALNVGLHLVLADGRPALPPEAIPDLVDTRGQFGTAMARAGVRFFFLPRVRRQLAAEIRAQYEVFKRTGLRLDHVNAHKHFHLHPTVLGLAIAIGHDYGVSAIRYPHEPLLPSLRISRRGPIGKIAGTLLLGPWLRLLKRRLQRASLAYNDFLFGLSTTGGMDEEIVLRTLAALPPGASELYFHPGTHSGVEIAATMPGYQHRRELEALISPRVAAALIDHGITRIGFRDLG